MASECCQQHAVVVAAGWWVVGWIGLVVLVAVVGGIFFLIKIIC
jgi:hypothetical protein